MWSRLDKVAVGTSLALLVIGTIGVQWMLFFGEWEGTVLVFTYLCLVLPLFIVMGLYLTAFIRERRGAGQGL